MAGMGRKVLFSNCPYKPLNEYFWARTCRSDKGKTATGSRVTDNRIERPDYIVHITYRDPGYSAEPPTAGQLWLLTRLSGLGVTAAHCAASVQSRR